MVLVRSNDLPSVACGSWGTASRLNLLLTCPGWQEESWADQLPRLLEPMGVRSLRARSGREARDVIESEPVHIAVVDLALPLEPGTAGEMQEAGARVLELLRGLQAAPPTVVIKRSRAHRDDSREINAALRAGAFAVLDRPRGVVDLELMLRVLRRILQRYYAGRWPSGGGAPPV